MLSFIKRLLGAPDGNLGLFCSKCHSFVRVGIAMDEEAFRNADVGPGVVKCWGCSREIRWTKPDIHDMSFKP